MNSNASLLKRFLSETPEFEKKVQLFGAIVLLVAAILSHFNLVPANAVTMIDAIAYTAIVFASLGVKDAPIISDMLEAKTSIPDGIMQLLGELPGQLAELKAAFQTPAPVKTVAAAVEAVVTEAKADSQPVIAAAAVEAAVVPFTQPVVTPAA